MKTTVIAVIFLMVAIACSTGNKTVASQDRPIQGDTIRIANDSLQYEVIIIDGGFNLWLNTNARPRHYYSQNYLEARNITWVNEWNNRTRMPDRFNRDLFMMPIDYQSGINYGYEVNYLLFNYLTYFQLKNNIRLGGFPARI